MGPTHADLNDLLEIIKNIDRREQNNASHLHSLISVTQQQLGDVLGLYRTHQNALEHIEQQLNGINQAQYILVLLIGAHPGLKDHLVTALAQVLAAPDGPTNPITIDLLRHIHAALSRPPETPAPKAPVLRLVPGGKPDEPTDASPPGSDGSGHGSPAGDRPSDHPPDPPPDASR